MPLRNADGPADDGMFAGCGDERETGVGWGEVNRRCEPVDPAAENDLAVAGVLAKYQSALNGEDWPRGGSGIVVAAARRDVDLRGGCSCNKEQGDRDT